MPCADDVSFQACRTDIAVLPKGEGWLVYCGTCCTAAAVSHSFSCPAGRIAGASHSKHTPLCLSFYLEKSCFLPDVASGQQMLVNKPMTGRKRVSIAIGGSKAPLREMFESSRDVGTAVCIVVPKKLSVL